MSEILVKIPLTNPGPYIELPTGYLSLYHVMVGFTLLVSDNTYHNPVEVS